MNKRRGLVLFAVLTVAIFVKMMHAAGELRGLEPHSSGKCSAVNGMPGAEDITFHPTLGYAYVSSDDRRASLSGEAVQGGIYRYDPRTALAPVLLTGSFKQPFHPHGISLLIDAQGKQTLYVINHPRMGVSQIERFELAGDGLLQHTKTLRDPALMSANDLVAVAADRLYVTNDHHNEPVLGQVMEDSLTLLFGPRAARGNVVYFDGTRFREVLHGTAYANGINVTRDGKTVVLAQSLAKSISLFTRNAASGELSLRKEIALDTGPDNIELDAADNLFIGAHPKAFAFLAHALDKSGATPAPAQVLRIRLREPSLPVEELYLSKGSPLSAVATAAVHEKQMLLGPVFERTLLRCQLP